MHEGEHARPPATFVVTALAFAVLDLYLSGHGRASPMQQTFAAR